MNNLVLLVPERALVAIVLARASHLGTLQGMSPALLGLISFGFLASSSSALLLPTRSQVAFRPACGAHRAPAAFAMAAETVEAAEDALAKATASEAAAVSELAEAIAADDDTVGCIVDAENAEVRRRATPTKPG